MEPEKPQRQEKRGAGWFDFSYNQNSDFLEIALDYQPPQCEAEQVEDGIMIKTDPRTGKTVGIWVYDFSWNYAKLRGVLRERGIPLPLRIAPDLTGSKTSP